MCLGAARLAADPLEIAPPVVREASAAVAREL